MPQPMPAQPTADAQQGNVSGGMPRSQSLAPQGDGQGQQQGQNPAQQVVGSMMAIQKALYGFGAAFSGKIPNAAVKDLQIAAKAYDAFLAEAMKALGVQNAPEIEDEDEGPQSDMGAKGAVAADGMAGGNPNAKPMY